MILYNIVLTLHILVCIVLIVVVLMQSSKGGGLAGAFGGGGDQTVFGGHETATFLSKATTYLAVLFMVLSLALAFLTSKRSAGTSQSVVRQAIQEQGEVIPRGQNIDEILGSSLIDTVDADSLE
jgi:preprotein translocase subunit SecG